MVADETEARIHELIAHHLKEVGTAEQGWSKLFIDQETHTFWELTYPHAEMHGGGPKKLTRVTAEIAKQKYGV